MASSAIVLKLMYCARRQDPDDRFIIMASLGKSDMHTLGSFLILYVCMLCIHVVSTNGDMS